MAFLRACSGIIWASSVCLSFAGHVLAQAVELPENAEAVRLFHMAKEHFDAGRFELACPLFAQSFALDATKPGVVFALAECFARLGKTASALVQYEEYLRAVEGLQYHKRVKHGARIERAKAQKDALSKQTPTLTLLLSASAPPGTRVTLDGEVLDKKLLGVQQRIDPGEHVVVSQVVNGPQLEQRLTLAKGENKTMLIEVKPPAPQPPPSAAAFLRPSAIQKDGTPIDGWRLGSYTSFGVGGAGFVVGVVAGVVVLGRRDTLHAGCPTRLPNGDVGCTSQEHVDFARDTRTLGFVSNAGFGVAAAGLTAGLLLLLLAPKESHEVKRRHGAALAVEVMRREHAFVSLKGIW